MQFKIMKQTTFNRNKIGSDDDKNYSLSKTNFDENTTIYEQISVLFYDESLGKDQKIVKSKTGQDKG